MLRAWNVRVVYNVAVEAESSDDAIWRALNKIRTSQVQATIAHASTGLEETFTPDPETRKPDPYL